MLWRILSLSVAVIAAFLAAVTEMLGERADFQRHRESIALALGVLGVILFMLGRWRAAHRTKAADTHSPAEGSSVAVSNTSFLRSLQYWGPMFMIIAGMTHFASPANLDAISFMKISQFKLAFLQGFVPETKARDKDSETNTVVAVAEFPPMKMQGVMASSRRPSAIINAKTYFIGDRVGDAVVTFIDRQSVTLELGGQTKVLTLRN